MTFIQALKNVASTVLTDTETAPFCTDWRGRYSGNALAVVFPANTSEVSEVVKLAAAHSISIVPQGGNTSLCGGSVPIAKGQQIVLNLSKMNQIRAVDSINYTMTVEAGCHLAEIYQAAEKVNRLFPLGLTAIAAKCEIGGNLSTNAGGIGVLRYGSARDMVLGLEVVLPDGRIWNGLRALRKDNTGYDLKQLFIGAEGTLGIITAAVLKLFPRLDFSSTACVVIDRPDVAVRLLSHIRARCGQALSGFELMSRNCLDLVFQHIPDTHEPFMQKFDWYVLIKLDDIQSTADTLREALLCFGSEILAMEVADDAPMAEKWWKLRKNISDAQKCEGISIKHDIAVPVSQVADFIEVASDALHDNFSGLRIVAFGHMGDGNIHYNVSMLDRSANATFIEQQEIHVNQLVYQVVQKFNGSISAEHGLGQLKRETIRHYKTPLELELMRTIKQTLDPKDIMNPGKVI
jgi:FAD/FMN-containing dehydrogenase